jgi:DNA polymerase III subunit chi
MTERVDFYVLNSNLPRQRWLLACRLAERAYLKNLTALILHDDLAEARALDDLLWTFHERAFVPHKLCSESDQAEAGLPVHIALQEDAALSADVLVNLSQRLPAHVERYRFVAEILDGNAERKRLGRARFKYYRDLKLTLETHQLNDTAEV